MGTFCQNSGHQWIAGWCFGTFFIFPSIGNNHPNWLIFFRGVETTNQIGEMLGKSWPVAPSVFSHDLQGRSCVILRILSHKSIQGIYSYPKIPPGYYQVLSVVTQRCSCQKWHACHFVGRIPYLVWKNTILCHISMSETWDHDFE